MVESETEVPVVETSESFDTLNLDSKLCKALDALGWNVPLPVQLSALPLALDGKDLIVEAPSGSGKTLVFLLPILHSLLKTKDRTKVTRYPFAVILTSNNSLCEKVAKVCRKLCTFCGGSIICVSPSSHDIRSGTFSVFGINIPDILIMTPALAEKCLKSYSPKLFRKAKFFVADDAFELCNFQNKLAAVVEGLKKDSYQSLVVSSNVSKEVLSIFKSLLPANLSIVRLLNNELPDKDQLKQFYIRVKSGEKYKYLLALLKFDILKGKCVVFCASLFEAYKLKVFLTLFGCDCLVVNERLPFGSREKAVELFHKKIGQVQLALTTDKACTALGSSNMVTTSEFQHSRQIDFGEVPVIVNFSHPRNSDVYISRARRTALRFKKGTVLSFVEKSEPRHWNLIKKGLEKECGGNVLEKFRVNKEEINKLDYRIGGIMSAISKRTVWEAEKEDLKEAILSDRNLIRHFKRNPRDLAFIESINFNNKKRWKLLDSMKGVGEIPDYLKPKNRPKQELVTSDQLESYCTTIAAPAEDEDPNTRRPNRKLSREELKRKNVEMSRKMNDYYQTLGLRETAGPPAKKKSRKFSKKS